ncbi:ATP-binding protein [Roseovarius sp. CAU 1744]|uniref:sensor histidine kinase n=1 Tax=Roseovarius sp. CAU 1744 TaxID=3140368 RepID=UPI00325A45D6
MTGEYRSRLLIIAGFLCVVLLCAAGIWRYGYQQALNQLEKQGNADLTLAADRLAGQLRRYRELAVFMAEHPVLNRFSEDDGAAAAERVMREAADKTGAFAMYYSDPEGNLLAKTGDDVMPLYDSAYFQRALNGSLGAAHLTYGEVRKRVYIVAAPSFDNAANVIGVLTVLVDLAELEWDWIGGRPVVFFATPEDEVFLSNRSELLFWRAGSGDTGLQPAGGPAGDFRKFRVGRHDIWSMNWGSYLPARALHLMQPVPVIDMTGHALLEVDTARRLALLQASVFALICLVFGAVLLQTTERRRTLARANALLEARVAERTAELSGTNRALRHEVAERQEAEAALKKAQAELVQAGKLSALGQMSAGISHELNQPLMAIQQFADNGLAFLHRGKSDQAGENLSRITQLAARAARIIRNLRAFARNESEPMGKVDLVKVITSAVELTEARLRRDAVALDWRAEDYDGPVFAWGGEVRLAQVFVNLINNAADAMSTAGEKRISIRINPGPRLSATIRDTGPGIADPEKIFEPFYSTKEVTGEEGMGLGLSISYGLVQSFGGAIQGRNCADGGAIFTVELEHWHEEQAA